MKKPPKYLWLQASESDAFGPTWCDEKIHDDDVKYVRADAAPSPPHDPYKALEVAREALDMSETALLASDRHVEADQCREALNQINQVLGDK